MASLLSLQLSCAVRIAEDLVPREQADLPPILQALVARVERCIDDGRLSLHRALKNRDPLIARHLVEVRGVSIAQVQ